MAENIAIYNKGKEAFESLMGYVDSFTEGADNKNGLLYYLKDSKVANLAVTKSADKLTLLSYKAFLMNVVLRVHDGGAELNYKLYEDYYRPKESIDGEVKKCKPYRMNSQNLLMYWGQETNDAFFDMTVKQSDSVTYAEVMKQDRRYPYFFLTHLLQVTLECLREYFTMDVEKSAMLAEKEEVQTRKRKGVHTKEELYARFVMAASLYEKFCEEFLGDALEKFSEQAEVVMETVKGMEELVSQIAVRLEKAENLPEAEKIQCMEWVKDATAAAEAKNDREMNLFMARTEWVKQYADHRRYLDTFCTIIYLIEFHNVNREDNNVPKSVKCADLEFAFQDALSEISSHFLLNNLNHQMSSMAKGLYSNFMKKRERQRLLLALCGTSERKREKALQHIREFMNKISDSASLGNEELNQAVEEIVKNYL